MTTLNKGNSQIISQISAELLTRHSLPVTQAWLTTFLSTVKSPLPPIPVLVSTAHFRILNSDITQSLALSTETQEDHHALLPNSIIDVNVKSWVLPQNIPVQVLAIQDTGSSKSNQIEAIERHERGEEIRGREIIRNVPIMNEMNDAQAGGPPNQASSSAAKKSAGPHKLLLQDAAGTQVWGFEVFSVPKLFITHTSEEGGVNIGCKVLLKRGCCVRRGMVMLTPQDVLVLGGKVDEWDVAWRKGRKERLLKEVKDEHERNRPRLDDMEA